MEGKRASQLQFIFVCIWFLFASSCHHFVFSRCHIHSEKGWPRILRFNTFIRLFSFQNLTGMTSEFVKKGAARKEKQVLLMVRRNGMLEMIENIYSGSDHGHCLPGVLGAVCCLVYYGGFRASQGKH